MAGETKKNALIIKKQPKTQSLLLNASYFTVSEHSYIYYIRCGNGTQQSGYDKNWFRKSVKPAHLFLPPPTESCLLTVDHWPLPIARWPLPIDHWPLTIAHCPLTIDRWPLTLDRWLLTVDCWLLTVDCCPTFARRKWKKYVTEYLPVMKKVVLLHADYYHDEPQKGSDSLWKGVSSIGLERCLKRKQGDKL